MQHDQEKEPITVEVQSTREYKKKSFGLGGDFSDSSRLPPRPTRSHAHGYRVFSPGGKVAGA